MSHCVLVVDDEANIRRMLAALLRGEGYEVHEAANSGGCLAAAEQHSPDAILLDLMMPPGPDGVATLRALRDRAIDVPVILMSGKANIADAVRATKLGAFQFLEKPLSPESVLVTLDGAFELQRARVENQALRRASAPRGEMVGTSAAMARVRELIAQVAPTDTRVLITGASGTGKELVAGAIHQASPRKERPFVTVNCAAIPKDLVESEMFGHERGAFTGATDRRLGRFELADGGTLLLDEIGDLSHEAQAKLLRTLETNEFTRVGGENPVSVDVRLIAATNRDLTQAVNDGSFRQDLYFRLNVFPIHLPTLHERIEDLPELVAHLARRIRPRKPPVFTPDAVGSLARYRWPGNVRELANIIERLTIIGDDTVDEGLVAQVLPVAPPPVGNAASEHPSQARTTSLSDALEDYERSLIIGALEQAAGNMAEAARILQTDRGNLYRRLRRLGIRAPSAGKSP